MLAVGVVLSDPQIPPQHPAVDAHRQRVRLAARQPVGDPPAPLCGQGSKDYPKTGKQIKGSLLDSRDGKKIFKTKKNSLEKFSRRLFCN
jgi:hypothetical protein